jgi:TrmH RNA methyltransferase
MSDEQSVYGVKAALALIERRPDDVLRLHYRKDRRAQLKGVLAWAAAKRLPYRELDEDSLKKVAGGSHHEGVVVIAKPLRFVAFTAGALTAGPSAAGGTRGASGPGLSAEAREPRPRPLWVAVDGVENPHNLGAILRSCAFFGADGVLVGGANPGDKVNQAAIRIAEGGAEYVRVTAAPDLAQVLTSLGLNGWAVLGLETDGSPLPRSRPARPVMLVLGHEHEGLRPPIRKACSAVHRIPGAGPLASLNVSVAAGVALALLQPSG